MNLPVSRVPRAALAVALACALGGAFAAGPAKPADKKPKSLATLGGGVAKDAPILTLEQLRECVKRQDQLHADESAMVAEQRDLDAEKAAIRQSEAALQGERAALDRTAASAVEAYNGKVIEHQRRIDAYNARSRPFNDRVRSLEDARQGFHRDCASRRYFEEDLAQIKAGR